MGKRTIRKRAGSPSGAGPGGNVGLGWLVIVGTVAVAVVVMVLLVQPKTAEAPRGIVQAGRSDVLLAEVRDPRMGEVEKRFRCPCGTCDKELVECNCGTAMEMKSAIAALLTVESSVDRVVATIAGRFPGARKTAPEAAPTAAGDDKGVGDVFLEVTELIDCPCGNCRLRLADCTCDRDRGAQEVKAFIRERIHAGRSASEVVAAFNRVYGSVKG